MLSPALCYVRSGLAELCRSFIQLRDMLWIEPHVARGDERVELFWHACRSDRRGHVFGKEPCERHRSWLVTEFFRYLNQGFDHVERLFIRIPGELPLALDAFEILERAVFTG